MLFGTNSLYEESSAENEVQYEKNKAEKHRASPLFIFTFFSVFGYIHGGKESGKGKKSGSTHNRFRRIGNEEKGTADTETCRQRSRFQKGMETAVVLLKE